MIRGQEARRSGQLQPMQAQMSPLHAQHQVGHPQFAQPQPQMGHPQYAQPQPQMGHPQFAQPQMVRPPLQQQTPQRISVGGQGVTPVVGPVPQTGGYDLSGCVDVQEAAPTLITCLADLKPEFTKPEQESTPYVDLADASIASHAPAALPASHPETNRARPQAIHAHPRAE